MITKAKLDLIRRYDFSIDWWVRSGTPYGKTILKDPDWKLIYPYLDSKCPPKKARLTEAAQHEIAATMLANCESVEVFKALETAVVACWEAQDKEPSWLERGIEYILRRL